MPPIEADGKFSPEKYVENLIEANKIVIFSKTTCPWCAKVKELFKSLNETYLSVELDIVGQFFFFPIYFLLLLLVVALFLFSILFRFLFDLILIRKNKIIISDTRNSKIKLQKSTERDRKREKIKQQFNSQHLFEILIKNMKKSKENGDEIKKYVISKTQQTTVPNVFIAGNHVGGYDDTSKAQKQGTLARLLNSGN